MRSTRYLWRIFSLPILVSVACSAAAQTPVTMPQENPVPARTFRISGMVVNAVTGAPLANAKVSLANTRMRSQRTELITSEGGRFEFRDLPSGKYSLQGTRRGYLSSYYEQHEQFSTAIVTGPDFITDQLILRLTPMGIISGHILDESGEAVRNAQVHLFVEDHSGGMSRVQTAGFSSTDDRGYFEFSLLRPGTYFAAVTATPWYAVQPVASQPGTDTKPRVSPELDVAYPTTYYGGATESDGATSIDLKAGENHEIEFHLVPVRALHFLLHVPVDTPPPGQTGSENVPSPVFHFPIFQKRVFDSEEFVNPGQSQPVAPGLVEVSGIPPGRYDLSIRSSDPAEAQQFTEIDVQRDGQDLNASQGEALAHLTVKLRGEQKWPRQYGIGLVNSLQKMVAAMPGDANGQASFDAIKPGKYSIVVMTPGNRRYAVTRTISGTGETSGHEVNVAGGTSMEIMADVTAGTVFIDGVVKKNWKPMAGIMVALVPKDPDQHLDSFRRDQSDFDGTFTLAGVIPGTYTIVAVEDAWGFDWLKPGVLARYIQHGRAVTIADQMTGPLHLDAPVEVQPR